MIPCMSPNARATRWRSPLARGTARAGFWPRAPGSGLQPIVEALSDAAGGVVVHADGDKAGPFAAIKTGRVRIEPYRPGESPAATLAGEAGERAGILEDCDGLTGAEAERLAWTAFAGTLEEEVDP